MDIDTQTNILTPFNVINEEYSNRVLITESIIVGKVPDTYYYYDDILRDNILDTK